ncbi:hypothetical protein [Bacillus seohaeanensis]|uniref:Uncharacterized protein n=1 Tax=Bacillus seohaeanensis TaxID=284580 RepID=A0ABW5RL76_9BACI
MFYYNFSRELESLGVKGIPPSLSDFKELSGRIEVLSSFAYGYSNGFIEGDYPNQGH